MKQRNKPVVYFELTQIQLVWDMTNWSTHKTSTDFIETNCSKWNIF